MYQVPYKTTKELSDFINSKEFDMLLNNHDLNCLNLTYQQKYDWFTNKILKPEFIEAAKFGNVDFEKIEIDSSMTSNHNGYGYDYIVLIYDNLLVFTIRELRFASNGKINFDLL